MLTIFWRITKQWISIPFTSLYCISILYIKFKLFIICFRQKYTSHFLYFHLYFFPENFGRRDKHGERFHQKKLRSWSDGPWFLRCCYDRKLYYVVRHTRFGTQNQQKNIWRFSFIFWGKRKPTKKKLNFSPTYTIKRIHNILFFRLKIHNFDIYARIIMNSYLFFFCKSASPFCRKS